MIIRYTIVGLYDYKIYDFCIIGQYTDLDHQKIQQSSMPPTHTIFFTEKDLSLQFFKTESVTKKSFFFRSKQS